MNSDETIRRGFRAREVLDNEEFDNAFSSLREMFVQTIETLPLANEIERDKVMISLQLLKQLKTILIRVIESGNIEQETVERLLKRNNVNG